jgi:hypothetical protein
MNKRIDQESWKYELKYSTGLTKYCKRQQGEYVTAEKAVVQSAKNIADKMKTVAKMFDAGMARDLEAWDCHVMYPQPKKSEIKKTNWLGNLSNVGRAAFEAYNKLKKYIPAGSTAGKGKVPGSPAMELVELMDASNQPEWVEPVETAAGKALEILDELKKKEEDDEDAAYVKRLAIWQAAVSMCKLDK